MAEVPKQITELIAKFDQSLDAYHNMDFSKPAEKARHDNMVKLVDWMLDLHKQLPVAKNPNDKIRFQREIEATDRQIDQLVCQLYGLTEEEIKTVEGTIEQ